MFFTKPLPGRHLSTLSCGIDRSMQGGGLDNRTWGLLSQILKYPNIEH
jgi:hypothetical protein